MTCSVRPEVSIRFPADSARGRNFLFYAVVFTNRTDSTAFLKRHNPGSVLKTGRLFGLLGQDVTRIDEPVLQLEGRLENSLNERNSHTVRVAKLLHHRRN